MKRYQVLLALGFAALAVLALTPVVEAALQECYMACTSATPCNTGCNDLGFPTTCGEWGLCESPPPPPACPICNNYIYGTKGGDTLSGTAANDCIYGDDGADTISGYAGGDKLHGGSQDDTLYGGSGDDCLYGGPGWDHLDGGTGYDYCTQGEWYVSCEGKD